ncbi:MAG: tetratricopeptide repeat protein [Chloroflexota bacterium]|nr:tetratricopeptide repeat protein [Chloroflexota bacterium]
MAELGRLLSQTRLLTVSGVGGSGKTRLALQVASSQLDTFADGVYLVELDGLADPSLLPQLVAASLGVQEQPDRFLVTTLVEHLRERRLLLILDNCEHLVQACASLVHTVLRATTNLRILATSRQALDVTGELTWRIPGLSLPEPGELPPLDRLAQYEAVQLFVERARFKFPDFNLTRANASSVVQLCRQLDGLPLAIEMAAARVNVLSVEQIARRLGESLRLLTDGSATAISRHRTLEAAIDWSYRLLPQVEQRLLRALSVFPGSFNLEAVHAICVEMAGTGSEYETLDLLSNLIDKSLVSVTLEDEKGEARYRLFDTIRQYAASKAFAHDESTTLCHKHLEWYLSLAERAESHLQGPEQKVWLDCLQTEHDNLRKALGWSKDASVPEEAGLRLVLALWRFWYVRGYLTEGRQWSEALLARGAGAPPMLRAEVSAKAGLLANDQGDYGEASRLLNESLSIFRESADTQGISNCLNYLGIVARNLGDYTQATKLCEESLALQEELGTRGGMAICLNNLGYLAMEQGNYQAARSYVERSLSILQQLGDRTRIAIAFNNLGRIACALGDYTSARTLISRGLNIRRELADVKGTPISVANLGLVMLHQADYDQARRLFEESLSLYRGFNDKEGVAIALNHLGELELYSGEVAKAHSLLSEALGLSREIGGKELTANVLINLAKAFQLQQAHARAADTILEALQLSRQCGARVTVARCLLRIACLYEQLGDRQRATHMLAEAERFLDSTGYVLHPVEQAEYARLATTLQASIGKRAWSRKREQAQVTELDDVVSIAYEVASLAGASHVAGPIASKKVQGPGIDLTRREKEVLRLLAEGLTDAQIAGKLFLSPHTVHAHLHSVYSKLDVTTRSAAVRFAIEHKLA